MNRFQGLVLGALALISIPIIAALAQVNQQSMPPNTVVGRLGVGTGPSQAVPLAISASSGTGIIYGSRVGNTNTFGTVNGTLTNGHCVSIDANSNLIDAGGACSVGGGGGTVNAGSAGQMAYYAITDNTVVGNGNVNISNGALTLGTTNTTLGSLTLDGSTSGAVTVAPQAAAGTWNFNLPTTAGTAGQVLTSQGGGSAPMTWASSPTYKILNGNTGVDPTGATDSATGINAVLATCPSTGCSVWACGYYKINATINIGWGVVIHGCAHPPGALYMTNANTAAYFAYNGASPMFLINGPVQGWGLENIGIDGLSTSNTCVLNTSGSYGHMARVSLANCLFGYTSTTKTGNASDTTGGNSFDDVTIRMPGITNAVGIYLSAFNNTFASADTCCSIWTNTTISGATGFTNYCIKLDVADTNTFNGLGCSLDEATGVGYCLLFSYPAGINFLPANNSFNYVNCATLAGAGTTHTQAAQGTAAGTAPFHNWVDRPALLNGSTWTTLAGISIVNSP